MESRSRRRPRRSRWIPALLLAVVALTVLVVASPAVAKPGHVAPAPGATLFASGAIAVIVIAACVALALILFASLSGRRTPEAHAEIAKLKAAAPDAGHRVAA